ncbi:MAG: FxsA family protein [Rhodobacteraceae bacterium]|nr:FxsA family protein [Paracoccaceae bacterium]
MKLFLLFLLVPLIEIAVFIQVGGLIGLFPTLAIIIITALLGAGLARTQFPLVIHKIKDTVSHIRDPMNPILQAIAIFAGGLLLLTPGFFTDTMGFLLLIPHTREFLVNFFITHLATNFSFHEEYSYKANPDEDIIEGESFEVESKKN